MPDQGDLPSIVVTLVVVAVILFSGTYIANGVIQQDPGGGDVSKPVMLDGNQWVTIGDSIGTNEQVYNSLGYAIDLNGSENSSFSSSEDVDVATDDTWTFSAWAATNDTTNETTAVSAEGKIAISYDGANGQWSGWYYDDRDRDSYEVNVSAPTPTDLTNVMLVRDGETLTIYRNTTAGESVDLSGDSVVSAPTSTTNWNGRVDEVRTFDDALTSSQRDSVYNSPVDPLPGTNRTARIMFDEESKSDQLLFFSSGKITTMNATYSDGLDGKVMEGASVFNKITLQTDYRWDKTGPRIKPVDGRELDGAPVAYVAYKTQSNLDTFADDWTETIQLAGILFILLPLGAILTYLMAMRNSR